MQQLLQHQDSGLLHPPHGPSQTSRLPTLAVLLSSILPQMPGKSAVLNHIDKKAPRPARKARALLVMGAVEPPVVREVLVTITYDGSGKPTASNMESSNIHSSKWATVPYNQRPHGVMDQVG